MPVEEQKIVHILRGLPGVGKTHFANRIKKLIPDSIILTVNDKLIRNGVFTFDKDMIEDAYRSTFEEFKESVKKEIPYIIIDNTNIKSFHYGHYVDYGQRHNYLVIITLIPHNDFSDRELEERNIHGVSRNTIRKMRSDFEWEFKVS